jgi:hypothetical protein
VAGAPCHQSTKWNNSAAVIERSDALRWRIARAPRTAANHDRVVRLFEWEGHVSVPARWQGASIKLQLLVWLL